MFKPLALRWKASIFNEKMDEFLKRYDRKFIGQQINAKNITFKFITRTVGPSFFGVQWEPEDHEIDSVKNDVEK